MGRCGRLDCGDSIAKHRNLKETNRPMRYIKYLIIYTIFFMAGCRTVGGWFYPSTKPVDPSTPVPRGGLPSASVTDYTIDGLVIVSGLMVVGGMICLFTYLKSGFPSLRAVVGLIGSGIAGIVLFSLLTTLLFWVKIFIGLSAVGGLVYLGWEVYKDERIVKDGRQ